MVILKRQLLFFLILIAYNCGNRNADAIQRAYRSDFYTPEIKVDYLRGKVDSVNIPEGKIIITCFRFESKQPVKIREREKYRKIDPAAIFDFLTKKSVMEKKDVELLLAHKRDLSCLLFEKKIPSSISASALYTRIVTEKKWIILWPKGKTYFVIHLRKEKYFFRK
ncbi:MAG: hypothetical protein GXO74_12230 [Calditrichaeota bacterium]|nr:hypothetical protein [Calditrichota bacterium]